ncbi:MAG TPA: manganese efflux pump, partial [Candidatus Saccharimonadales bacterium]|nr:manganese efflux pump [Candidatus Saccharimonadales bacterium]
ALIGHGIGSSIGNIGGYAAGIVIGAAGIFMLMPETEGKEEKNVKLLSQANGWSVISLGLSISIDGLAVGFSLGLLKVPLLLLVGYVALQTFVAARIGLWLGGRLNDRFRNNAERFGGIVLLLVAVLLIITKATGHNM